MVCQQMISTSHFIKTQKIRYGWHGTEEYDPFISLKNKKEGTDSMSSNDNNHIISLKHKN